MFKLHQILGEMIRCWVSRGRDRDRLTHSYVCFTATAATTATTVAIAVICNSILV